jgi:hypothetical protein
MKTAVSITVLSLTAILATRSEAFPVYNSQVYDSPQAVQQGNGGGYQMLEAYCDPGDVVLNGSCWTDDSTAWLTQSGAPTTYSWVCSWNNNGSTRGNRRAFARCAHNAAGTSQWETSKWTYTYTPSPGNGTGYDEVYDYCLFGDFPIMGGCVSQYGTDPALTQSGFDQGWICSWNDNGLVGNNNVAYTICQSP